ncbi:hypothetical protein SODALDRAFT_197091 [Sodiomyces alkalinus F11]|uniref:Uncharacterized protein n=1 Tax=Sodiomyces alkalinus (strain CBS 110278 / VKM F-3762 / F11) TaxID=1314773 RepID=A0A3N2PSI6_SODAK|nr:hypothetical protein SODALDRAFT_197091 [Sodiomyces alkalinus F11]ROT37448.1 hypothetical protein SODALDRAFT_197091 [Sodiomyces alkalinus F11]
MRVVSGSRGWLGCVKPFVESTPASSLSPVHLCTCSLVLAIDPKELEGSSLPKVLPCSGEPSAMPNHLAVFRSGYP